MATNPTTGAVTATAAHLKRTLGVWDLTWLCVVAIANLNVVPVIAASGPTTIWLWLVALIFFFLPQGIAVIDLAERFPAEGGIYLWAKEVFGDFHGFMCGWCYWNSNLFFIPTLLFYFVGIVTFTAGPLLGHVAESPVFFFGLTTGLLWVATLANVYGMGVGKWINNAGGFGTLIAATILIVLAIMVVSKHGMSIPASSFAVDRVDWKVISSFAVICFGLVGLELGPIMGDEIRDPRRTVPRGVLTGGILSGALYVGATTALLIAVPQESLKVLQGVLQGVDGMTKSLGVSGLLLPLAFLVGASIIGSTSAWLSGSARILFVSGLDRYLPRVFGKVHPRYGTPHIALIGMAGMSTILIAMSFAGQASVKEAYVTLLDLAVVLQMLSYVYLYGSLAVVAFRRPFIRGFYGKVRIRIASISGLATTIIGLIVAFVPSRQVESVWLFEMKMFVTCIVFLALAGSLFAYYSRKRAFEAAV